MNPNLAEAYMNLAWVLSETDQTEDAVDAYAHGLRMNATGTAVTRGSRTQRPSWTLSDAAGPLVERHSVTGVPYLVCVAKNLDQIEGMSVEESRATLHELMLPGLGGEPQVLGTIDEETGLTTSRTVFNPGVPRLLPLSLR